MRCLKCGSDIDAPNVFCEDCLLNMKNAPVSRETHAVILPRPAPKVAPPRAPKAEELLEAAQKRLRRLRWVCALLAVAALALTALLIFWKPEESRPVGQTYTANIGTQTEGAP